MEQLLFLSIGNGNNNMNSTNMELSETKNGGLKMLGIIVIAIIGEVAFLVRNFNKLNFRTVTNGLLMLFNIWLAYFVNRLLLTMCYKSLA